MNSPTYDISVVICAYTEARWDALAAAVDSMRRQTVAPLEIIVVIDHNQELLERVHASMPDIMAVENRQLPGASGSRNTGVEVARGAIVAFLDDDAEAAPDWLEHLCPRYQDPCVLGVGGSIRPNWLSGAPGWFPPEFTWVVGCTYRGMPETTAPIRNLIAANMSVRRPIYQALGGFRAGFGNRKVEGRASWLRLQPRAGDEEAEFCIRGLQMWPGSVWLHEPRARVSHRVPAPRTRFTYFLSQCYDEGLGAATIARELGDQDGLSLERTYVRKILPRGVARGLADAVFRRDRSGLARSAAIVAGLATTATGFLVARVGLAVPRRTPRVP